MTETHHNEEPSSNWVANAITIVSALVICVVFTVRLEGHTDLNRQSIEVNVAAISKIEARQDTQYREITRLLEKISDKLDTKADK